MRKVPPELDQLMWAVAEQRDPAAIEDFGARFPELRAELIQRVQMVGALRGTVRARKSGSNPIPNFQPRVEPDRRSLRMAWALASFCVLLAIGYATYSATSYFTRATEPVTVPSPTPEGWVQKEAPEYKPPRRPYPLDVPDNVPQPPIQREVPPTPSYMRPKTIRIDRAPLQTVITMIGMECGLQIEIAPGMDNPDIEAVYENVPGIDMLKDMGTKFGFTVFPQGQNRVLIIPATDSGLAGTGGAPPL